MMRACLEPAEARRPAAASTLDRPVPASPAAVREEGFPFRLRTNRLLQNAALLVRPQLAALGLNSFQAAACEAQRRGATFILTSPDRQIAAGAHRFDEAEINQFLDDFLRGPASQARWRSEEHTSELQSQFH